MISSVFNQCIQFLMYRILVTRLNQFKDQLFLEHERQEEMAMKSEVVSNTYICLYNNYELKYSIV